MHKLNNRQATILIYLLKSNDEISFRDMSKEIGLPVRIIRFNLPNIESWLQTQNVPYNLHQNAKIRFVISENDKQALLKTISNSTTINYLSSEDRLNILIFDLLSEPDYHSGPIWQHDLNISRATLTRDLNRVENWLANHSLFLKRSPRSGTRIIGSIINQRHALIELLYKMKLESELLNYFIWHIHTNGKDLDTLKAGSLRVLTKIHDWEGAHAWQAISKIQEKLGTNFTESSQLYLTLYWSIMLKHLESGHIVTLSEDRLQKLKNFPEYDTVSGITSDLITRTNLNIPDSEFAQLTLEIITSIHGENPPINLAGQSLSTQPEIKTIIDSLVSKISTRIGISLTHPEVLQRLEDHLIRSLIRSEFDLPIRETMGEEVKQAYPEIWKACQQSIQEVVQEYGISIALSECGYITMYIVLAAQLSQQESDKSPRLIIVCPSGGVTVWMLLSRIKAELPEFKILDVVSIKELNRVNKDKAAAIVTTVKLKDNLLPVIKVSPLLNDEDVQNLRLLLHPNRTTPSLHKN